WHGAAAGEHGHAGYLSGFKSVAHGADGLSNQSNQLVFDDTTGRLRTQLATDSASTQLNLGHLIHQADNYRGTFRGTGWEMRTDSYGAVRAGKGLLMTTYYGTTPDGKPEPAGENTGGIALMKQAQGFADTFNGAASTHQTVQMLAAKGDKTLNQGDGESALDDKVPPLKAMLQAISGQVSAQDGSEDGNGKKIPHSTAPIITIAAQAGLGMTASDGLHYAAGEAAHFASGRDTNVAVGEAMTMHSGQAVGILAGAVSAGDGDTGIKLFAGQGDIDLQAQSDTMTFASKDLMKFISANSHIDFAAAKSIELCTEQGASLKIEGGNITFACPGLLSMKGSSKSFAGPTSQNYALPPMPRSSLPDVPMKFDMRLQDVPGLMAEPYPNTDWRVVRADSKKDALGSEKIILSGVSDSDGNVKLQDAEEKVLRAAYNKTPNQLWLVSHSHARELAIGLEQSDWTERDKFNHGLNAIGYADSQFSANGADVEDFFAPIARKELKTSSGSALFKKIKKGA
ncbi:MAG: DUF2345 domain-containing protein, partial [Burkholderiaceae bacterium]